MLVFEAAELESPLPRNDRRVRHILKILKKGPGDELLAGVADGPVGTARIDRIDESWAWFTFKPERESAPLFPLTVLLGFPRPIQAGRLLKDLCSLGVERIILSGTELGEKSYFQSDFFRNREFRSHLLEGAEQSCNPRLPVVETAWSLTRSLEVLDDVPPASDGSVAEAAAGETVRVALDPYRDALPLGKTLSETAGCIVLAAGSERGWTQAELDTLASREFSFATLGERILKTETAVLAAACIVLSRMGYM